MARRQHLKHRLPALAGGELVRSVFMRVGPGVLEVLQGAVGGNRVRSAAWGLDSYIPFLR